ncbi:MAG: hypothetical protein IJH76_00050 [Clostridia bacterium]|nr:hypothetical protein [Clostridia bacterium]
MNQILSTESSNNKGNYKKSGGTKDVRSVAKFFAIAIFIFGIILIATSSFALYKNGSNKEQEIKMAAKPTIEIEKKGEEELIITVTHEEGQISNVVYYWNQGNKTTIDGKNGKYIQKTIQIPSGTNILHVSATDSNQNKTEYSKEYVHAGDIKIDISQSGNNVKIAVDGKNELQSIKYNWDEEEVKTVNVEDSTYSLEVEALVGEHSLHVTAVDSENNTQEKTIKVIGTTKPTLKIEKGDNCYVITAHDDIALKKIEIVTMNDGKVTSIESDGKDFSYKFPLKDNNDNFIKVTAYNTQNVPSKVIGVKWQK